MSKIALIAAVAEKGAIGRDQQLLCHLPNDLKHFKTLTSGHTVVMGRKTFESLPNGALPNRKNIVLTHNTSLSIRLTKYRYKTRQKTKFSLWGERHYTTKPSR